MMPCRRLVMPNWVMPNSWQFTSSCLTCRRDSGSAMASTSTRSAGVVGTLWSTVAITVSRRQGLRPALRSPSKACGLVTS
jgi:hypothetical protein